MEHKQMPQWPGWTTVKMIGQGSFGAVYEIERDLFGKKEKAALKHIGIPQNPSDIDEMFSEGYDDESIASTFQTHLKSIIAEYSLMRELNGSANVVNCDDVQYVQRESGYGWDIYIKMELLTPLTKAVPAEIPESMVRHVAADICQALMLCRKHNIIHRDIKPQNIFVSENDDFKLGDFGIAKTVEKTMGGTKTGTYKYMAPEVYFTQPYGHNVDIYSLGLVLYWMLNKKRMPFMPLPPVKLSASIDEQARNRRLSGEPLPPPADGSEELKRIVLKACAYDPKKRYHTAEEMLADLQAMEYGMAQPYGNGQKSAVSVPQEKSDEATSGFSFGDEPSVHTVRGPQPVSDPEADVCPSCGSPFPAIAQFCPNCGHPRNSAAGERTIDGTVGAFHGKEWRGAPDQEEKPTPPESAAAVDWEDGTIGAFGGRSSGEKAQQSAPAQPKKPSKPSAPKKNPSKPKTGTEQKNKGGDAVRIPSRPETPQQTPPPTVSNEKAPSRFPSMGIVIVATILSVLFLIILSANAQFGRDNEVPVIISVGIIFGLILLFVFGRYKAARVIGALIFGAFVAFLTVGYLITEPMRNVSNDTMQIIAFVGGPAYGIFLAVCAAKAAKAKAEK